MYRCTSPTYRLWLHGQVRNLAALVERGWQGLPICGMAVACSPGWSWEKPLLDIALSLGR